MADAIVNFVFGKLKEQAFQEVSQEVIFQWRIKAEVEKISGRLANMKGYIEDSGKGKQDSKVAESWATQLRDTTLQLEDLVEEFMLDSKLLELNTPPCNFCQVKPLFANVQSFAKRVKIQFCFHQQLKAMDEKLLALQTDKTEFSIKLKTNDGRNELLMGSGSGYMEGIEAVGIDMEVNRIAQLIDQKRSGEVKLITIWGAGGCGKTTLAKQVHERVMEDRSIDCCWWVDVNHSSDIEYVLRTTINGVYKSDGTKPPAELEKADTNYLQQHILDYLGRKRYVVFFDDVWDLTLLGKIELPGNRASSIIVTSRDRNIATGSFLGATPHYVEVKPLEFDLACTLFCKLALGSRSWPNGLEEAGKALVEKCSGLPVAILAMARLMSTKGDDPSKWRDALKTLDYYSHEFEAGGSLASLNRALLLSYYELPTHLKSCFLYCAMFPKTYGIRAKRLIRMCIAEGFINDDPHPHSGRTLEHIARDYFLQLKNRSLLQIIPNEYNGKELGTIEMHDLYREVACEVIRREMFAEIIKLKESTKLEWKQRRSLIILEVKQKVQLENCYENMKKLRTLIIDNCVGIAVNSFPHMLQNMKLLRVLVLKWLPPGMKELPTEVGDLIHLTYLDLCGYNNTTHLPDSLGRLHNLQTLDLRGTLVNSFPKCVSELKKLRHLFGSDRLPVPDAVFTFSHLQTLSGILINTIQARELVNIPQLTKLNISFNEGEECWSAISDSVNKMTNLHSLSIESDDELQEFINFSLPLSLKRLKLIGFGKLVNFISTHNYLRVISIHMCDVDEDFFNSLEKLPSLLDLFIHNYSGDKLLCSEGSFPKLKRLVIVCEKLTKWEIGKGGMTCLESLTMMECKCLEMLPEGLREVEHLKKLHLISPSQQLIQRISIEGSDRRKIEHILRVIIQHDFDEKPLILN